jgi:antidote-toxin recognition MazE-like antitoxin
MAAPAERMKTMRERRRKRGLRELRLMVPDPRLKSIRNRVAAQVVRLDRQDEERALRWIESVSDLDAAEPGKG